jgi:hypothetical protein
MTHWFPKVFALFGFATGLATIGCAQTPQVHYAFRARAAHADPRAEALAIQAAQQHPNAQPRVRPQYPEQTPPPLPQGSSLPAPAYVTRRQQPLQLSAPTFADALPRYSSYTDFAPSYAYPYGYYAPAYPTYGYRLGYGSGWRSGYGGWRSGYGYGWGPRYAPHYNPWVSTRAWDRPSNHRHQVDHHHGDYRPGSHSFSRRSHDFHGGGHGSRPARTDIRVRR